MSTSPTDDVRVRRGALLVGFALVTFVRAPWLLVAPRFFAEEGIVYFRYALDHGLFDTLTAKHLAYYALVPNVATALSARLPLAFAPYATLAFAFVVQLIPAFVVAHDRDIWKTERAKSLALLVLLFPLAMRREWLSTIHAQFWLALAMCLMLVVAPRSRSAALVYAGTTVTAALTGALSAALAPWFLLLGLARRDRRLIASGLVLGAGALLQVHSLASARSMSWDARELFVVAAGKLVAVPLAGKFAAPLTVSLFAHAHTPGVFMVTAVACGLAFTLALRALDWNGKLLLLASTYLGVASLVASLGSHADLAVPLHGIRYAFVPNVVYGLLLVWGVSRPSARSPMLGVALGAIVVAGAIGAASAARYHDAGLAFRRDARAYANDAGTTIRVHDARCRLAVSATDARRGFAVSILPPTDPSRVRIAVAPGVLDRDADLRFFVVTVAPASDALATFDGTRFHVSRVTMIGGAAITEPGMCAVGGDDLAFHAVARTHGERVVLDLPRAALRARPLGGVLYVGYGRDEADALAKGTFIALPGY